MLTQLNPFPYWVIYFGANPLVGVIGALEALARAQIVLTTFQTHPDLLANTPAGIPVYMHRGATREYAPSSSAPAAYVARTAGGVPVVRSSDSAYAFMDWWQLEWSRSWARGAVFGSPSLPGRVTGVMSDQNGEYGIAPGQPEPAYGWLGNAVPDMSPGPWVNATPGLAVFDQKSGESIRAAREIINAAGYDFLVNAAYMPYGAQAGAVFFESFISNGTSPDESFQPRGWMERDFFKLGQRVAPGTIVLTLTETQGNGDWRRKMKLSLGLWLIGCDHCRQRNYYCFRATAIPEPVGQSNKPQWQPEYDIVATLGKPINERANFGGPFVWRRNFTNGFVIANYGPTATTLSSAINGSIWGTAPGPQTSIPARTGWLVQ